DRDLVRHDQPRGVGGGELVHGVVERFGGVVGAFLHGVQIAVAADLAVEDLGLHAVGVHVFEAGLAVGVAFAGHVAHAEGVGGLGHLALGLPRLVVGGGARRHHLLHEVADGAVVGVVVLGGQVLLDLL